MARAASSMRRLPGAPQPGGSRSAAEPKAQAQVRMSGLPVTDQFITWGVMTAMAAANAPSQTLPVRRAAMRPSVHKSRQNAATLTSLAASSVGPNTAMLARATPWKNGG